MKILLYDIETAPLLSYTWGLYETNVIKVVKDWNMLSFAYKWYGGKKTHVKALPDYKNYKKDMSDDSALVKDLWDLFNEADIIIGHNSDRFDIRKTNARFIKHGLLPPPPHKTIDTLKLARKYFKFDSNHLTDIGKFLDIGEKVQTGGFALWEGCMAGDKKSWKTMIKYNRQDVVLLEKIYEKMRPWMHNHPAVLDRARIDDNDPHCLVCGSDKVQRRGWGRTTANKYQRYQCECGKWGMGKLVRI